MFLEAKRSDGEGDSGSKNKTREVGEDIKQGQIPGRNNNKLVMIVVKGGRKNLQMQATQIPYY